MFAGKMKLLAIIILASVICSAVSHLTDWARFCGGKIGLFRHPDYCDRFIACAPSNLYVGRCPEGLHFNAKHTVCDWPYKAKCTINRPSECPNVIICKNHVKYFQFPDFDDCNKFYVCITGVIKKKSCPTGMHYDYINWSCTVPSAANCFQP